jgi:putative NADH-flavin reductase
MKIALIGPSGFVGSALLKEALSRGHHVTAIARNPDKIEKAPEVTPVKLDANDVPALTKTLAGHDVVISAFNGGHGDPEIYKKHRAGSEAIRLAARAAGIRTIFIGGAGSLHAPDGSQFVDSEQFPKEYRDGALAARDALGDLRGETELDWTFVSPAFVLTPGERSGKFRLGGETPVANDKGESTITVADLAVAVLDEAEQPKHSRKRFTVGY